MRSSISGWVVTGVKETKEIKFCHVFFLFPVALVIAIIMRGQESVPSSTTSLGSSTIFGNLGLTNVIIFFKIWVRLTKILPISVHYADF